MVEWTTYLFFWPVRLTSSKTHPVRPGGGRKEVTSFRNANNLFIYCYLHNLQYTEHETRKNRGLDWIASAAVSMEGCQRDSVSGEHSRPRSASPPSRPPVFPGLVESWM
jgi:hypothetical protein